MVAESTTTSVAKQPSERIEHKGKSFSDPWEREVRGRFDIMVDTFNGTLPQPSEHFATTQPISTPAVDQRSLSSVSSGPDSRSRFTDIRHCQGQIQEDEDQDGVDISGEYRNAWSGSISTLVHKGCKFTVDNPVESWISAEGTMSGTTLSWFGLTGTISWGVISWSNGCVWTATTTFAGTPATAAVTSAVSAAAWAYRNPHVRDRRVSANFCRCAECEIPWRWQGQGTTCHERWYCDACWNSWLEVQAVPQSAPRYTGNAIRRYGGRRVHVLQVGLGNFATFINRDTDWIDRLLRASSWNREEGDLRGIGVDPNESCVGPLERDALSADLVGTSVVLAAIGEGEGTAKFLCLPSEARARVRREMTNRGFDPRTRANVDVQLAFIENMGCVETLHADYMNRIKSIREVVHLVTPLIEKRAVPLHTFESILRLHDAGGCEVFIVDAEGSDASILRSMMSACNAKLYPWPRVICMEAMGHADQREHGNVEESVVQRLQLEAGYLVVAVACDVTLVHGPTVSCSAELSAWADATFTIQCRSCGWHVSPSQPDFAETVGLGFSQWTCDLADACLGTWCCRRCAEERRYGARN